MGNQKIRIRKQTDCRNGIDWRWSLIKNIDLLAEYHTGLPSRVGQPVEHLAHGYTSQIASPIYATAVGLLKYSIDNKDNAANAYVEEFKSITSAIQEDKIEK